MKKILLILVSLLVAGLVYLNFTHKSNAVVVGPGGGQAYCDGTADQGNGHIGYYNASCPKNSVIQPIMCCGRCGYNVVDIYCSQ